MKKLLLLSILFTFAIAGKYQWGGNTYTITDEEKKLTILEIVNDRNKLLPMMMDKNTTMTNMYYDEDEGVMTLVTIMNMDFFKELSKVEMTKLWDDTFRGQSIGYCTKDLEPMRGMNVALEVKIVNKEGAVVYSRTIDDCDPLNLFED